jgi:hypothetical protein
MEKITRIGEVNGAKIIAMTDLMGSQTVVFTKGRTYVSPEQKSHEDAIILGKYVMNGHTSYFKWDNSVNDFSFERDDYE